MVIVDVVQVARIYAIYNRNTRLLVGLVALVMAEVAFPTLVLVVGQPGGGVFAIKGITGCWATSRPRFFFLAWLCAILFQIVACFLLIIKAWKAHKHQESSALLNVILRDSILYFLAIFACQLVNLVIWASPAPFIANFAVGWAAAVPCAVGSRILLSMREEYFGKNETVPSMVLSTVHPMWQGGMELHHITPKRATQGLSFSTTSLMIDGQASHSGH